MLNQKNQNLPDDAPAPCVAMLWDGRPDTPSLYCAGDDGHGGDHHAQAGTHTVRWSQEAGRG